MNNKMYYMYIFQNSNAYYCFLFIQINTYLKSNVKCDFNYIFENFNLVV